MTKYSFKSIEDTVSKIAKFLKGGEKTKQCVKNKENQQ